MPDIVDTVAQAIWQADDFKMGDPGRWTGEDDHVAYRKMAQAAIDALGLTLQWGHSIQGQKPVLNKTRAEAERALREWCLLFPTVEHHGEIWSRLGSPWVRAETTHEQ